MSARPSISVKPSFYHEKTLDNSYGPRTKKSRTLGALRIRRLPHYTGPYNVGSSDVELKVDSDELLRFGTFEHKKYPNQPAGIQLETLLFSLFYPCIQYEKKDRRYSRWFPAIGQMVDGFLRMARHFNTFYRWIGCVLAFGAIFGTTYPAQQHGRLLTPPEGKRWPVVFFSHGVGCSRLMYSQFCGELASRGYIVVAIEHRDGSGPSSTIVLEDGTTKIVSWLAWQDLNWPDLPEQPTSDNTLRKEQLKLRLAELKMVSDLFQNVKQARPVFTRVYQKEAYNSGERTLRNWIEAWDVENLSIIGHSFGGTLALAAAADPSFNFKSIVAFDPAMERLEPWCGRVEAPVLFVNSEEFFRTDDFDRLVRCSSTFAESATFAIGGATHPSFSDINLILPPTVNRMIGLRARPEMVFSHVIHAVMAFFHHGLEPTKRLAQAVIPEDKTRPLQRNVLHLRKCDLHPIQEVTLPAGQHKSVSPDPSPSGSL